MKLIVLHGMIASGKSTYARNAAKKGMIIVSDDSIVNAVHADDYTLYNTSLKILYKSTENHIVQTALAMGRTVVVDRGLNISDHGRKRWVALAHSLDVPCEIIVFPRESNEVHALRRVDSDSRGYDYEYWLRVATTHGNSYSTPLSSEGWDIVRHITWEEVRAGV